MKFNVEKTTQDIIDWIKDWFENYSGNAKGIIIGISGGKDSTVVAKLCAEAIGKDKVFGVLMPNGEQKDIQDSIDVCNHLGINYRIVNIGKVYDAIIEQIRYNGTENIFSLNEHTKTNIPPRLRMTTLYAIGQEMGYRVAGTGNASEAFIGYFTKWGDGACDFNPIADLTTDEVIAVGDYLGLPHHLVHKTPADGLCGKSDEDNLGYSYKMVNKCINTGHCSNKDIEEKIKKAHEYNKHKTMSPPKFGRIRIKDKGSVMRLSTWYSADYFVPQAEEEVIANFVENGKHYQCQAVYVPRNFRKKTASIDWDWENCEWYDGTIDDGVVNAGWYEVIHNLEPTAYLPICGKVTHWKEKERLI